MQPKVGGLPGPNAKRIIAKMERYAVNSTFEYPSAIRDGRGCYLLDVDGNWFLDFNSNIATQPLGYGHPAIRRVLARYAKQGAPKIGGQDFYSEEHAELVERLVRICPAPLRKAFLVNSGAEAVENAIKFAYRRRGPYAGISCHNAFHGRTIGALSLTHSKSVQKENYPEIPHHGIRFVKEGSEEGLDDLEKLLSESGKHAFLIVEPIQGEGGYVPASDAFLKRLRQVTREHDIPLIFDEVQCGMGRTGKWWAFENYGVVPDIMAVAKALQVGAVVTSQKYAPPEKGAVSSTWGGGHRIDMAVGATVIETIQKEKLLQNVQRMGEYFVRRLKEFEMSCPIITEVRGKGLMIGVEINKKETRDYILLECFKRGLFILGCGAKSIRIAPPLVVGEAEAVQGLEILEDVLKDVIACRVLPRGWRKKICPSGVSI